MGNILVRIEESCFGRKPEIVKLEEQLLDIENTIEEIFNVTNCCAKPQKLFRKKINI